MKMRSISVEDVIQFAVENVGVPFCTLARNRPFKIRPSRNGVCFELPSGHYYPINRGVIAEYLSAYNSAPSAELEKTSIWPSKLRERSYIVRIFFEIRNHWSFSAIKEEEDEIEKAPETIRKALTLARVGQGQFRDELLADQKCCYVTGIFDSRLLRAAHIRPWSISTNEERLDRNNGLLLSPAYDHLFDRHLISFRDDGRIMISRSVSPVALKALGVDKQARGAPLAKKTTVYLAHHRREFERLEKQRA